MEEIWRDVPGYEGLYQVSNFGRVKSLERDYTAGNGGIRHIDEHCLLQYMSKKGYLRVKLYKNGKGKMQQVHRLVAEAFIQNPDNKPQVDHINGDKSLNVATNLRWATNAENSMNPNTVWKNNHPHTKEWKEKMSVLRKGKTPTEKCLKAAQESHKKKIEQYDKNGCLIRTYNSLTEASTNVGVTISAITNSVNRGGKCKGFIFNFLPSHS